MVMSLDVASTLTQAGENELDWNVPAGWEQGRGAYGGLVIAAMMRAMLDGEEPERTARAVSASLTAPVLPGPATITVTRQRAGNAVSSWMATLSQEGEFKAMASLTTGRDRPTGHHLPAPAPSFPPWQEVPVLEAVKPPLAPVFLQHFEVRGLPPYPFTGAPRAEASAWIRPRIPTASLGAIELAAMADVCWPAAFVIERAPRPMATIAFHCAFTLPAGGLDPAEPLLHRGAVVQGAQGYFSETRELWTPRGELVAYNPQVFAWIK